MLTSSADAKARQPDAITRLYTQHYGSLVRLAALLVDDPATCEDVVQEAYVRAWSRRRALRDQDRALAYLRQTVVNLARSSLRRRLAFARLPRPERLDHTSAEREAILRLEVSALAAELGRLSRRQREVVVLRYLGHMTEAEVAAALGIAVGSVKAYGSRGLDELGQRMKDWR